MATDNGTRLVALFHDQSLSQDRFRLTAIVAGGQLQAQFFGFGTGSVFADHPVDYGFNGEALALRGLVRVVEGADWFAGLNVQQVAATIHFDTPDVAEALPDITGKVRLAGVGPEVLYDSRDDKTYPTASRTPSRQRPPGPKSANRDTSSATSNALSGSVVNSWRSAAPIRQRSRAGEAWLALFYHGVGVAQAPRHDEVPHHKRPPTQNCQRRRSRGRQVRTGRARSGGGVFL